MTPLRQRMLHDMQIRNLALNTQKTYLLQVSSFARYFRRSPEVLGPEEIRAWIIHLTNERKLAPASVQLAVGALRFLYRTSLRRDWSDEDFPLPRRPVKLPVILSFDEVTRFFESIPSLKQRAILMTAYAAGLRVGIINLLRARRYYDIDSMDDQPAHVAKIKAHTFKHRSRAIDEATTIKAPLANLSVLMTFISRSSCQKPR
ncbi:Tyrosine recombinase XerC [Paraburkholderia ultramafica]|uniref:Tyrosine recombinase XerC n=1 Tax=Paraburkholderia ultramafica TaxID=1544867 RepID=A0A6S7CF17_9BURK|nr:site-specific integrase [Paraburkholderia ultramafica]CAB3807960.1 Tyrosine recombinase XerC [Paraburkholderia ultramafica]